MFTNVQQDEYRWMWIWLEGGREENLFPVRRKDSNGSREEAQAQAERLCRAVGNVSCHAS